MKIQSQILVGYVLWEPDVVRHKCKVSNSDQKFNKLLWCSAERLHTDVILKPIPTTRAISNNFSTLSSFERKNFTSFSKLLRSIAVSYISIKLAFYSKIHLIAGSSILGFEIITV